MGRAGYFNKGDCLTNQTIVLLHAPFLSSIMPHTMKRTLTLVILALALSVAGTAQDQTIRIVSEHRATHDSEKTYHTAFNQRQFVGILSDKKYTLSCLDAFGIAKGIEVGQEYRVVKVGRNSLTIEVPVKTKKGERLDKTELSIISVELADPK